ncbi:MAG TPA: ABC transporter ATP-binding protein [Firmicutes bacterium]|nr:ABC transporter ATP-binding protein [Bacillota bacterium]
MIELNDVSVGYRGKPILSNISFTVSDGEICALLGHNGCGKSTLLRAVMGSLGYTGSIRIDGQETRRLSNDRAKLISLMPQLMARPSISVYELVSFGRQPYTGISGILSKSDRLKIDEAIQKTRLEPLALSRCDRISGGELQRAYLAMVLAQDTPNLLLDEPAAHLDARYERQISDFLLALKADRRAVLAVLHNINHALSIADRIIVIDSGKLVFNGNRAEFSDRQIAETYFGLRRYTCRDDRGNGAEFYL